MELYVIDIPEGVFQRLSNRIQKTGRCINDEIIEVLRIDVERPDRRFQPVSFDDDTQRALSLAQDEARRLNHNYVGTEHILLGLVAMKSAALAKALAQNTVATDPFPAIRSAVEFIIGRRAETSGDEIQFTRRAKKAIELAQDEARWLGDGEVNSWHLLVGIWREGGSAACSVLESFGITFKQVYASR